MATKDELQTLLESRRGEVLSGEEAAVRLKISRAAVWKAVEALRARGLAVQSIPGAGYCLPPGSDLLSPAALRHYMDAAAGAQPGATPAALYPLRVLEELDSTNLEAKRWAIDGAPHGSLVAALRQTAGRGRRGRVFASPPGGLYLSVVLRPAGETGPPGLVTAMAAVAACRAVSALCGVELGVKWVNDLYLSGKKCCGILTEAGTGVESGQIEYLVVGIGINYTTPPEAFPPEVAALAGSLFPGGVAPAPRAQLAAGIHAELLKGFAALPSRDFLGEYRRRSLVLGRRVTVMASPPWQGVAEGIDDEARLLVRRDGGAPEGLSYGEISIKI